MELIYDFESLLNALLEYKDAILTQEYDIGDPYESEWFYSIEDSIRLALKKISDKLYLKFNAISSKISREIEYGNELIYEDIEDQLIFLYNKVYLLAEKNYFYAIYLCDVFERMDYKGDWELEEYYGQNIKEIPCGGIDEVLEFRNDPIELDRIVGEIKYFIDHSDAPVSKYDILQNVHGSNATSIKIVLENVDILSIKGMYYSISKLLKDFIQCGKVLTVTNLVLHIKEIGMTIPSVLRLLKKLENNILLINKEEFAIIDDVEIPADAVSIISQKICNELANKKCCAIRDLFCIPYFPKIKTEWNEWLIYSVIGRCSNDLTVDTTSKKFRESIPIISLSGITTSDYIPEIVKKYKGTDHSKPEISIDDIDNIDDLIADCIEEDLPEDI